MYSRQIDTCNFIKSNVITFFINTILIYSLFSIFLHFTVFITSKVFNALSNSWDTIYTHRIHKKCLSQNQLHGRLIS